MYQTINSGLSWIQLSSLSNASLVGRLTAAKNDTLFVNQMKNIYWTLDGNSYKIVL
jgi:hypothetical protein